MKPKTYNFISALSLDGISSTGKPVVNATENHTGGKCGRVGEALLLCTV